MILGQIIHWIVNNREVYFAKYSINDSSYINHSLLRIIQELKRCIPYHLKEEKTISISHFITFFTGKNKNGQIKPHYSLHSDLTTIVQCQSKANPNKPYISQDICKLIGSSLLIERETVQMLLIVFAKAIRDLVANGSQISLNLQFCLIKLNKTEVSCVFRKSFIKELNIKQVEQKNHTILLSLCPTTKCKEKDKQNITKAYQIFYDQKQRQIEQGNIFKRASLREIKALYERGRELQIKYKNSFE